MLPATVDRVPAHTSENVNERIRSETRQRIRQLSSHPERIPGRLEALDREWDIERALEASAASFTLLGVCLASWRGRRWMFMPGVVAGFLLQHALQGWCPPLPVFRRFGFRTSHEIEQERHALEMLQRREPSTAPGDRPGVEQVLQRVGLHGV